MPGDRGGDLRDDLLAMGEEKRAPSLADGAGDDVREEDGFSAAGWAHGEDAPSSASKCVASVGVELLLIGPQQRRLRREGRLDLKKARLTRRAFSILPHRDKPRLAALRRRLIGAIRIRVLLRWSSV
jgi:hypothetical protein